MIPGPLPDRPSRTLTAAVAVGVVLVAVLVAVYLLDLNPWGNDNPPGLPVLDAEPAAQATGRVARLERSLRDAGRSLPAPIAQMLDDAAGRDRLFVEAIAIEKAEDYVLAASLYRRLARSGHGKSALRLAEFYDRGRPGVARDYSESLQWYEVARQLGERVESCSRRC